MPLYKYKALRNGEQYEGVKSVADKISLYNEVKREGGMIVSVEEKKERTHYKFNLRLGSSIKLDEKITFAKNLAVMIESGIPLSRSLGIIGKQARNKKLSSVINALKEHIDQGKSLSESARLHDDIFPNLFIMMVKAGEESGKLVESLRIIASQMERSNTLTKKIRGAMIYPTMVITVMIILGIILMVYMVPTLTETFKGLNVPLPLPTRIIIAVSDFMSSNFALLLIALGILVLSIVFFFRSERGKKVMDFLVLHLPLIATITRELNSARTARTLSSLTSSGVDIVIAIGVTKDVLQNSFYKKVLEKIEKSIQQGVTVSSIFGEASNLYPVFVSEMTAVGEETGQLSAMLENIANFYESEVDRRTKDLSTIIEPVLMILIGGVVGIFAIAMLLPTYSLVDVIQ